MPIPDFQTAMAPFLRALQNGEERSVRELTHLVGLAFQLTADEFAQLLPSGRVTTIHSRVGWARTYLKNAGLIEPVRRGVFRITDRGREALAISPDRIDVKFLRRYPEFTEFEARSSDAGDGAAEQPTPGGASDTPEEAMDSAHRLLRRGLEADLLDQIMSSSPAFFEQLVVDLLVRMGYGGSLSDAGKAIGRSGDGGIDGIIKEDRLGLDAIYVQAKKWENTIGRPEIQKFAGALQGQRARKGVFITTSNFSSEAQDYVSRIDSKIVLIDGDTLVQLMVDFSLGVATVRTYDIKKIDSDYFLEN